MSATDATPGSSRNRSSAAVMKSSTFVLSSYFADGSLSSAVRTLSGSKPVFACCSSTSDRVNSPATASRMMQSDSSAATSALRALKRRAVALSVRARNASCRLTREPKSAAGAPNINPVTTAIAKVNASTDASTCTGVASAIGRMPTSAFTAHIASNTPSTPPVSERIRLSTIT